MLMMKERNTYIKMRKLYFASGIMSMALFGLVVALPAVAHAEGTETESTTASKPDAAQLREKQAEAKARLEKVRVQAQEMKAKLEVRKEKLDDAKKKVCEKRQANIKKHMTNTASRGERQLEVFTKIADRVQKFYVDKKLSVANYDELVAAMESAKADVKTAVEAAKSDSTTFQCGADNPKGLADTFKGRLKVEIEALKAYRTSVKNLIVAVKSAAQQAEATKPEEESGETQQ
jgi:predicted nucleotidyltransferase